MPMVARTWEGMEIEEKINRAAGRGLVGIGVLVSIETKRITHIVSGTLARSVHASPLGEEHSDDEDIAESTDMLVLDIRPEEGPFGPVLEVGSWLPYACVEWVGRNHPGITQGLELVRGARADGIMRQAFREEGL